MQIDDFVALSRRSFLGGVAPAGLQVVQVGIPDVAGDVLAGENRGIEAFDLGVAPGDGVDQVIEVLVDQPVGADRRGHLLLRAAVRDQLMLAGMSMP